MYIGANKEIREVRSSKQNKLTDIGTTQPVYDDTDELKRIILYLGLVIPIEYKHAEPEN